MIKEFVCNISRRIPYEYICRQKITNSSGNLFFWMERIFFEVLSECLAEVLFRRFPLISFCNNSQCRRIVKKSWGDTKNKNKYFNYKRMYCFWQCLKSGGGVQVPPIPPAYPPDSVDAHFQFCTANFIS